MEPIKEALQRARQERELQATPHQGPRRRRSAATPASVHQVEYVHTRTIPVTQETLRAQRVVAQDAGEPMADAYKLLRTRVLQNMRQNHWNSLAITSPAQGQGKTLTSVNLAVSLAAEVNQTVLLVDLDLRRPQLHNLFGVSPQIGLHDYIENDAELSTVLFNPGIERLVVLPNGKSYSRSSEMLSSPKMVDLIDELKSRYPNRFVIFDLPPLLAADDVLTFLPHIDAVLLVVEERKTLRGDVKRSLDLLANANLIGTVLNNSSDSNQGYYYY